MLYNSLKHRKCTPCQRRRLQQSPKNSF